MRKTFRDLWPSLVLLALCGVAYFAFHAVRDQLPSGFLKDSLPSLLTPLAMFSVIELMPNIRFHTRRTKYTVLAVTTLVAAIWLEAVVPRWTQRASGDVSDAIAMGVGFCLFCLYDLAFVRSCSRESAIELGQLESGGDAWEGEAPAEPPL